MTFPVAQPDKSDLKRGVYFSAVPVGIIWSWVVLPAGAEAQLLTSHSRSESRDAGTPQPEFSIQPKAQPQGTSAPLAGEGSLLTST